MSRIFLSHSSRNNAQALALRDWLVAHGWGLDDLFLDIDPRSGIAPGERWQRALNEAAGRCEAVVFIISRGWLDSRWCLEELALAHKLNKRLFGVLVDSVALDEVPGRLRDEWQLIDLESGRDGIRLDVELADGLQGFATFSASGLDRLRTGLVKAGLDPRHFPWPPSHDPDRAPFRGLAPMEEEDAGIFYGREAAIIAALDELRGLEEGPPPRLMAVLGASGAGKSSFVRAGLIPRLRRDDHHFLVLPVLRPERTAIAGASGLVAGIARAARDHGLAHTRADVRDAVKAGAEAVSALLGEIAAAAARRLAPGGDAIPPALVLPIDQAEELFLAEGRDEALELLGLLAELLKTDEPRLVALMTIRTDAYEELQLAPVLTDIRQVPFNLPALARGAYQRVIEGPAERLAGTARALKIDPALTSALLSEIEEGGAKDALPLLAFAMERLYIDHGSDGDLTLAEYVRSGRIAGAIEAAVERALAASDGDPGVPRDTTARLALLRRAMIPWLAGIDPETRSPRRQVARFTDIPEEARPLIVHFVEQRLLATDISPDTGERTVEPAHEALLRQWGQIDGWLREDIAVLATMEGVRRAARDWEANARGEDWLAHSGGRLEDVEAVRERDDLARRLDATDLAYLAAARAAETARRDRELEEARKLAQAEELAELRRASARRTAIGAIAAVVLAVCAIIGGIYGAVQARIAQNTAQRVVYNETVGINGYSQASLAAGRPEDALKLALAAWPRKTDDRPPLHRTVQSAAAALVATPKVRRIHPGEGTVYDVAHSSAGTIAAAYADRSIYFWPEDQSEAVRSIRLKWASSDLQFLGQSELLAALSSEGASLLDLAAGKQIGELNKHKEPTTVLATSPDGSYVATGSEDQKVIVWSKAGKEVYRLSGHHGSIYALAFSPDSKLLASGSSDRTICIWDVASGRLIRTLSGHNGGINAVQFSPDGSLIVSGSDDSRAIVWRIDGGTPTVDVSMPRPAHVEFSPDGSKFLAVSRGSNLGRSDTTRGATKFGAPEQPPEQRTQIAVFDAVGSDMFTRNSGLIEITAARFSTDSRRVVITFNNGRVEVVDAKSGGEINSFQAHADKVTATMEIQGGKKLVTGSLDGWVKVWQPDLAPMMKTLPGGKELWSANYSRDGEFIALASPESVSAFQVRSGRQLWQTPTKSLWAAISPGNEYLAAAAYEAIELFDFSDAELIRRIPFEGARDVLFVSFSPDSGKLIASGSTGLVLMVDMNGYHATRIGKTYDSAVVSAEFSPDGGNFVVASLGGEIEVWDAESVSPLFLLSAPAGKLQRVSYSRDGSRLFSIFAERGSATLRLWDSATGEIMADIAMTGSESQGLITMAAYSPHMDRIAVNWGPELAIWDTVAGVKIAAIPVCGSVTASRSVTYSPGGSEVLVSCGSGYAEIRDVSEFMAGDVFELACRRLGPHTDITETLNRTGLDELPPICGNNAPTRVDMSNMQEH